MADIVKLDNNRYLDVASLKPVLMIVEKGKTDVSVKKTIYTKCNFKNILIDTNNAYSSSNNTYTIPEDGWYLVFAQIELKVSGVSRAICRIDVDDGNTLNSIYGGGTANPSSGYTSALSIHHYNKGQVLYVMAKTDQVDSTIPADGAQRFIVKKVA